MQLIPVTRDVAAAGAKTVDYLFKNDPHDPRYLVNVSVRNWTPGSTVIVPNFYILSLYLEGSEAILLQNGHLLDKSAAWQGRIRVHSPFKLEAYFLDCAANSKCKLIFTLERGD